MNNVHTNLRWAVLLVICTLVTLIVLKADKTWAAESDLATEISRLTDAVNRLAELQKERVATSDQNEKIQRLSLAIAYLDYRSKRIEALEREMSSNRNTQERLEDFSRQISRRESALEEDLRNNPQMSQQEALQMRKELEDQKKLITDRIARIDGKLIQLDNEIINLKSQLAPTERYVQSNLEF
jgi:chromosome segregation ATPase